MVRNTHQSARGFTLIELLIAITILAVLASAIVAILNPFAQMAKGRDAKRKADLSSVQKALELYYQDNGRYPPSSAIGEIMPIGQSQAAAWGGTGFAPYIARLPKDSYPGKKYAYFADATGQTFWLFTSLERKGNDPQTCNPTTNAPCTKAAQNNISCGSTNDVCNFGVSSPNNSPN
jgi:general secretion pathway protein G